MVIVSGPNPAVQVHVQLSQIPRMVGKQHTTLPRQKTKIVIPFLSSLSSWTVLLEHCLFSQLTSHGGSEKSLCLRNDPFSFVNLTCADFHTEHGEAGGRLRGEHESIQVLDCGSPGKHNSNHSGDHDGRENNIFLQLVASNMAILVVESLRTRHCRKARVIAVGKIDGELRLIYRNLRKNT